MSDVVEHLVKLGLSEYEAKAYVATVALGEGTIKEISDESKVPRSRAYDVMERLLQKGFVEVGNSQPRCYRANDPSDSLNHLMDEIRNSRDEVVKALNDIGKKAEKRDNPIWTIKGEWAIDHKVSEMLETAHSEVTIISMSRSYLIRYAKQIAKTAETKSVTVLMENKTDEFEGLLGRTRLLQVKEKLDPPTSWMKDGRDIMKREDDYDVDLVMVCDHSVAMLLSKEGSGHRGIISNGTIVDYVIDRLMGIAIRDIELEERQSGKNGKKNKA